MSEEEIERRQSAKPVDSETAVTPKTSGDGTPKYTADEVRCAVARDVWRDVRACDVWRVQTEAVWRRVPPPTLIDSMVNAFQGALSSYQQQQGQAGAKSSSSRSGAGGGGVSSSECFRLLPIPVFNPAAAAPACVCRLTRHCSCHKSLSVFSKKLCV
jgi:hypothetical protein